MSDDERTFELELVSDDQGAVGLGLEADPEATSGTTGALARGRRSTFSFCNLPDTTVLYILLAVTEQDDLLWHVSICARVCKQWYDVVTSCPAYAGGRGATFATLSERGVVLRKVRMRLRRAISGRAQAGVLYLSRDRIGDSGACVLNAALQAIRAPLAVRSLVLSRNALTASGLSSLVPSMQRPFAGEGLQTLDVSGNRLFCGGVAVLARMLPTTLLELRMNGVGCRDTGMMELAAVLPILTNLRFLDCSFNGNIRTDGWAALATAMPQMPTLLKVEAAGCIGIGGAGMKALAAGLPRAAALQHLDLNWCQIGDVGAQTLAAVVPRCTALTTLYLKGGEYGRVGRSALLMAKYRHILAAPINANLQIDLDPEWEEGSSEEDPG